MFQIGCSVLFTEIKACVRYFLSIFSPNDYPSKTIKKCFLFHLKALLILEIFNLGNFLSPFPHYPDSKEEMEVEYFLVL